MKRKLKLVKKPVQTTITSIGVTPTISVGNMFSVIDYDAVIREGSKSVDNHKINSKVENKSSGLVLKYNKKNKYFR